MKKSFQILSLFVLFIFTSLHFTSLHFTSLHFTSLAFAEPVNINTASAQEISKNIKGVGLKKAEQLVLYRKKNTVILKTIESLAKVKGIGFKTVEKNCANLSIVMVKGK